MFHVDIAIFILYIMITEMCDWIVNISHIDILLDKRYVQFYSAKYSAFMTSNYYGMLD